MRVLRGDVLHFKGIYWFVLQVLAKDSADCLVFDRDSRRWVVIGACSFRTNNPDVKVIGNVENL